MCHDIKGVPTVGRDHDCSFPQKKGKGSGGLKLELLTCAVLVLNDEQQFTARR